MSVLQGLPSRIGLLLDMTMRELERVLYFELRGHRPRRHWRSREAGLSEEEFREAHEEFGDAFVALMGAEAIRDLLERLDLDEMAPSCA